MNPTYKVQIGIFKTESRGEALNRVFIPVFEEANISAALITEKLSQFVGHGWTADRLEEWLHKPGREQTFLMDKERFYGYRVIKEEVAK